MTWFSQQKELDELIAVGELKLATERFQQLTEKTGVAPADILKHRRRLTQALLQRASALMAADNLTDSWLDMSDAKQLAADVDQDQVSRQMTQLIELTIEEARAQLFAGRASHALQLVAEIERRGIEDYRVDQLIQSGRTIKDAERLSSEGKFGTAVEILEALRELQPEIQTLQSRIQSLRQRNKRLADLSKRLQSAALECRWVEVGQLSEKILGLAPRHEIAIAAKKHSLQQMKRRTNAGSRITNVPESPKADSFFQAEPTEPVVAAASQTSSAVAGTATSMENARLEENATLEENANLDEVDSFLVWVDGVGGYLVCIKPECMIGQAIEGTTVDIPLQADLRLRHARIELISGQHLVQPLGDVSVDGLSQDAAFVLRDGQTLGLGNGVKLMYSQTHPYSKTSRLDFTSRHRTRPWSDAVLLASQSVIMGPSRHNHVYCPRWKEDLVFFCRKDQWYCRSRQSIIVDNAKHSGEAPIRFDSHITGPDFSMTLEPVFPANPQKALENRD